MEVVIPNLQLREFLKLKVQTKQRRKKLPSSEGGYSEFHASSFLPVEGSTAFSFAVVLFLLFNGF